MSNAQARMIEIVSAQSDDATYEEIMRELAFGLMIERGMEDFRNGRTISNEAMKRLFSK